MFGEKFECCVPPCSLTTYPRPRTDHRLDLEWVCVGVKQGIDGELNQLTLLGGNHIHIEVKFGIYWELN